MEILPQLRKLCLALPEARETTTFGHPTFQAGKKTFAVLDEYGGERCLVVKLALPHQQAVLKSPRFFASPYGAKHGWVCLKISGRLDFDEVRELCLESYRAVALKRMLAALDGGEKSPAKTGSASRARARSRRAR